MAFVTGPQGAGSLPLLPSGENKQDSKNEISFKNTIKNFIEEVNNNQIKAEEETMKFARGESRNIHEAMIALEKANMSLQFTLQVRNKIIDAYQEMMRMQI